MNKDIFDKKVADRVHQFEMKPDDAIWNRIEATLDAKPLVVAPRRKLFIPITSSIAVAAAVILSFLLLNDKVVEDAEKPILKIPQIAQVSTVQSINKQPVIVAQNIEKKVVKPKIVKNVIRNKVEPDKLEFDDIDPDITVVEVDDKKESPENRDKGETRSAKDLTNYNSNTYSRNLKGVSKPVKKRRPKNIEIGVNGNGYFSSSSSMQKGGSSLMTQFNSLNKNSQTPVIYEANTSDRLWEYDMPLTFSITLQKMITRKIGIETGISYTYLSSRSKGTTVLDQDIKQRLNYLGIPLSVVYSIYDGNKFGAYAKFGFLVDKAISAQQKVYLDGDSQSYNVSKKGVQVTSMLQAGVEYNINKSMSLYLEPTLNYYFDNNQPNSYRTDNEFGFSAMIGLKFKF